MSTIRAFRALRPVPAKAGEVASKPYDVMNTQEAKELAQGNPVSFLRVVRAEIAFPDGADAYSDEVYQKGRDTLEAFFADGVMIQDETPCLYIYRQKMGDHIQTGLVTTASCVEYDQGIVRKHEFTRPVKEADRVRHIETLQAQTGPVWITYRAVAEIDALVGELSSGEPTAHFTAPDGIEHSFWVVSDAEQCKTLEQLFTDKVPVLYIADGHHRSAAASIIAAKKREQGAAADDPSQFFLSVVYPDEQMMIMAYNRFVHDLNGHSKESFLEKMSDVFEVSPRGELTLPSPAARHQFDMYLDGEWYSLQVKDGIFDANDPVASLDVSILQEKVLTPILNIEDPRTSNRIDFVGGIRGHKELERLVQGREGSVAFACYPTSIQELLAVADNNEVMPPKSTWFEPKLRSGLFVNKF